MSIRPDDIKVSSYELSYAYDTEIIPAQINQGQKIEFFSNKFFADGSEKKIGTDYFALGDLGVVPRDNYFKVLGFGFDFEFASLVDDIYTKIVKSSYIKFIVGSHLLGFLGPLKWFSWIADKPILDLCKIEMPENTRYNVELSFNNIEELSKDLKFQLIMKYERYAPIR
jgi:hypothetical protein